MSVFDQFNGPDSRILFDVVEREVGWKTKAGEYIPTNGHKALVRVMPDKEPRLLNVVGASYKLIHNKELFGTIEETIERIVPSEMLVNPQITDKVSGFGRQCFREYVFPSTATKLNEFSQVAFRLIVQNGYGGSALRIHAGAIDFFCTNGIIRGDYTSVYNKHTAGLVLTNFTYVITRALELYEESKPMWLRWVNKPIPHRAAMKLFRELASSTRLQEALSAQYLVETTTHGETLWAVYSTMTYYASHNEGEFALRKTVEEQDTVANTMLNRELNVSKWIETDAWNRLEDA